MKKKKVCVLGAQVPFVRGGAELMVESLIRELRKRDFDAELIQLPFKWYPCNSLLDNILSWRLLDITESNGEKIDLVIGTKFPSYVPEHPNKVLWLMHQHRPAYDLYNSREYAGMQFLPGGIEAKEKLVNIDTKALKECKNRYAISQNVANRLKRFNNETAEVLYHPPSLSGRYLCEDYGNYIVSIGRLDLTKRTDMLIRALPFCDNNIKAKIGGKGPEIEKLKELSKTLGVSDRVEFLGFVTDDELLKLYANSFAVFFAPLDEDYGYITLEAFLSRKPVVTCKDSGGVLEFVEDGRSGYICDVSPEDLGNKINQLYKDKKRCELFGKEGFETVKGISWNNVINSLTQTIS